MVSDIIGATVSSIVINAAGCAHLTDWLVTCVVKSEVTGASAARSVILCSSLSGHRRVVCLQPEHELQNADELVTLLLRHPQGMFIGQVKDAYKGILDDVKVSLSSLLRICSLKLKSYSKML